MKNKTTPLFDLSEFEKIEDIIFLDEPILTHLKKGWKDYFLYLVKTNKSSDIYLLFEVGDMDIYEYLTHAKSLWEIITTNENFFFVLEQDFEGDVTDFEVKSAKDLDPRFLPSRDSFMMFSPTKDSHYFKFIEELKAQSYLLNLREKAFYLKIKPTNDKYGDTIGFMELSGHLLTNISNSYGSFLEADFYSEFKTKITDEKHLKKSFKNVKKDLDYRMVDLRFGSFEIGLAIDITMKTNIERKDFFKWAVEVGEKYKELVLDEDYDEETVNKILERFLPADRKKIFEPIFKIIENPNFSLSKRESYEEKYHEIKIKYKSAIEKILPIQMLSPEIEDKKDLKVVRITTVIDSKKSSKSIKLDENTLFDSSNSSDYILRNKDFEKWGYEVDANIEVPLEISAEGDTIIFRAVYEGNIIDYKSAKMEDGMKKIISKIFEYIVSKD